MSELLTRSAVVLRPEMTLSEVARYFSRSGVDGAAVVNGDGKLIGLVTKSDIVRALSYQDEMMPTAAEIMTTEVYTLKSSTTLDDLQQKEEIFRFSIFPVVDDQNRPLGYLSRTDLVKYLSGRSMFLAEEMKAILDSVYNGVVATNEEGRITLFNEAAEAITGLKKEEAMGQMVDEVFTHSGLRTVLSTGAPQLNQRQRLGNCEIVTNRSPIIKGKQILGAVAVFEDITQLQAVAAELEYVKELKSTLECVLESFYEGIVIVDVDGKITMLNRTYGKILGVEPQDVIGKHVTEVIQNTRMHIVAQTGKAETYEVQIIGNKKRIVSRIPIIREGKIIGAVGKMLFGDVKEWKVIVQKLNHLQSQLEYYREELRKAQGGKITFHTIVGDSGKMQQLKHIATKAAKGTATVLILGESGTGKELFASAIHYASPRSNGPFIKVNCAAVPENLLESEMFGYDEGAFTGARKGGKPGKFELAAGGTIFLDEIGDMPLSMQAKLLRILQEKEFERVGGTKTIRADVRVIASTNRDLDQMMERGEFRQDLFYRLNIITLTIDPLRERREDIPPICGALLSKLNHQIPNCVEGISPEAMEIFMNYSWPGNVRELENVLERAVNLMDNETHILPEHLPPAMKRNYQPQYSRRERTFDLEGAIDDAEKAAIDKALQLAGGNKSLAAKILGIHRSGLYQKLRKYAGK